MKSTAQILENVANSTGADFRPNYSGRGMYGKECVGIVGMDLIEIVQYIITQLEDEHDAAYSQDVAGFAQELQEILEELSSYSNDSMGTDTIIYWPEIQMELT